MPWQASVTGEKNTGAQTCFLERRRRMLNRVRGSIFQYLHQIVNYPFILFPSPQKVLLLRRRKNME